jgi:DNA-binding NarL/FixJ family response regulator
VGIQLRRRKLRAPASRGVLRGFGSSAARPAGEKVTADKAVVIIDERVLIRDCLAKSIEERIRNHVVLAFASITAWQETARRLPPAAVIILCASGRPYGVVESERVLLLRLTAKARVPVVVISDAEGMDYVLGALKNGARGYIPTSVSLDVAIEAMRLVEAGGTFVPASSLIGAAQTTDTPATGLASRDRPITARQAEVVRAVQSGKANKQIAHELNMRESTVKAHIRNLMKKLHARNRTEVAILTYPSGGGHLADRRLNGKSQD